MFNEVDKIIVDAIEEAGLLHNSYLGSEHLLLAILRNEKLPITRLLNTYGMRYNKVRMDLIQLNYNYGFLSDNSGYSECVKQILHHCENGSSIIMEMMNIEECLGACILSQYAIPMEKVMN